MIPTVNVTVAVHEQDGSPVRGALVFARLTAVERYNGYVVADEYTGRTDERGRAVVAVFPNELGSEGSEYRFRIVTPAGKTFSVYATVPNNDCNLHQICELEPAERRGAGQVISSEIAGYAAQAGTARDMSQEAANRAQAAAVQVDVSAQTATAAASLALSNANTAKRAAEGATGLVQRTETVVAGFESEVIGRVEAETQRLGGEASTAISTAKDQAITALDAHTEQKTEGLGSHAADLKAALTASLGEREEEAIGAVRIEREAALVVLREEGAQFREDLNTLAERSEDAAKRAACSAATTVKAAFDVDEVITDTALELLAPQVVTKAVRQATEIALDSANTATVEAEKSRQSAETACACADESAASAQSAADSATAAETSAGAAADSASAAASSEAAATTKAGEASASATAAKVSEGAAKASEESAADSADTATAKAGEASVSATAAGVSEANAAASATAASASATVASAAQTAAEAACEETKKVAVLPATTITRGSVKADGMTISVTEDGTITAKDVAIGGKQEDLASARGQIGDYVSGGSFDFNNEILDTKNIFFGNSESTNKPFAEGPFSLQVKSRGHTSYKWISYFLQNCGYTAIPRAAIKSSYTTDGGVTYATAGWSKLLDEKHVGDGISVNNGIISVPEMQGATSAQAGVSGLVPPPLAADAGKVLGADGTWSLPKDVAIGGNQEDLASARGIFDTLTKGSVDCNTLTEQGVYAVSLAGTVNGPGFSAKLVVFNGKESTFTNQMAIATGVGTSGAVRVAYRAKNSENVWSPWSEGILNGRIGDGITINNGIISVPEYEGATSTETGTSGLVPPAAVGQQESFLTGGGEYKTALTKISDSVELADSTTAASAKAVKTAYDLANGKQANLGFTPVQQSGGAGQEGNKIYIGWSPSGLKAQADALDLGNIVTTSAGCTKAPSAANADLAWAANRLRREGGVDTIWNWAGQGGQPSWLWGGNDGANMYVYNPANFSVNYANSANSANYANSAGSAPANGGTAWAVTVTPNIVQVSDRVPSGGTWLVERLIAEGGIYSLYFVTVAGGTRIGTALAIRTA